MSRLRPLLIAAPLVICSHTSIAEEKSFAIRIPAQPLPAALESLAQQTGIKPLLINEVAKGKSSHAVNGQYTTHEALTKLLEGTGLSYSFSSEDSVIIKAPDNESNVSALPAVKVSGKAVYDSTDPYNPDYNLPNASTATKTDTPIMETPFSIQVVPKQVMEDVQAVRPGDALNYVSGIYQGAANSGDWLDWSKRRGFDNFPAGDYRNGAAFPLASAWGGRDLANVERVEVLKGPASLLYGLTAPGGVVNYVTKQPLATPYYSLQQQFGSYDFYRTTVDATGPITGDKSLLYRLNLAYKDANSFRDMVNSDRIFIAPTVTWNISPKTQVNFELEYDYGHVVLDRGIPAIGNRPADVPRNRFLGEADPQSEFERILVGMNWSHDFNDNWTFNHRFTAVYNGIETRASIPAGVNADNRTLRRNDNFGSRPPENDAAYFNSINLTGHFDTFGLRHTLLLGGDYLRNFSQSIERRYSSTIDIFNPTYLGADGIENKLLNPAISKSTALSHWFGLYLQDQIKLPFNFSMLAGFRYDGAENERVNLINGRGCDSN